jgi:hypothetical protein
MSTRRVAPRSPGLGIEVDDAAQITACIAGGVAHVRGHSNVSCVDKYAAPPLQLLTPYLLHRTTACPGPSLRHDRAGRRQARTEQTWRGGCRCFCHHVNPQDRSGDRRRPGGVHSGAEHSRLWHRRVRQRCQRQLPRRRRRGGDLNFPFCGRPGSTGSAVCCCRVA